MQHQNMTRIRSNKTTHNYISSKCGNKRIHTHLHSQNFWCHRTHWRNWNTLRAQITPTGGSQRFMHISKGHQALVNALVAHKAVCYLNHTFAKLFCKIVKLNVQTPSPTASEYENFFTSKKLTWKYFLCTIMIIPICLISLAINGIMAITTCR